MAQGSIPRFGVIRGLSLLVLFSDSRGFSPGTPVFLSPQKTTCDLIERVSIECRKTKTKVIILANQKGRRLSSKPIKTQSNSRSRHKARENVHALSVGG